MGLCLRLCVGLSVEVLRTNGTYTRGTIDAVDSESSTYTIRMDDGRTKYMVEEEDLRLYRVGGFTAGDRVRLRSHKEQLATIAEYDDDSETYSLILADGRRMHFVSDDEILR